MQDMNSHFLQVPLCDLTDYMCAHIRQIESAKIFLASLR